MKKIVASLLFLTTLGLFAQQQTEEISTDAYLTNRPITFKPEEVHYAGSAYENQEFVNGYIFKNGKALASNVPLRYNALRDEFEVKENPSAPNQTAKVMVKDPDIYVKILNKLFVFYPKKEGIDRPGYFLVLAEGDKADLCKKISKEFIEGQEAVTSMTRSIPPTYKEHEDYYLFHKTSDTFEKFPSSRNRKFNLFGDAKKEVKSYAKKEDLNVNKEWALKKVVKHYNSL